MLVKVFELQVFNAGEGVFFTCGEVSRLVAVAIGLHAPVSKIAAEVLRGVGATATVQHIVTSAAVEGVVAARALKRVVAEVTN